MSRDKRDWADDLGLYHRLRNSVMTLARGAGTWNDRAKSVFESLYLLRPEDFPEEFKQDFETIRKLHEGCIVQGFYQPLVIASNMSPAKRTLLVEVVFRLYEEMLKERVRQGFGE